MIKIMAVPSFVQDKNKAYALDVLANYLMQDENSPLYQKLVLKDKKALSIDVTFDGISRSYGVFSVGVIPQGELNDDFEKFVDKAWSYAIKRFDEAELEKIKKKMLSSLVYLKDNPASLAQITGWMVSSGVGVDELQNYEKNIKAVSLSDVLKVADFVWNIAPKATGILNTMEGK